MQEIRVLMVDDHSLFREGLGRLLQAVPDFRVVGECSNLADALAIIPAVNPDVILLDYDLGEQEGSGLLPELKRQQSTSRVLMVTAGMSDAATLHIMEAGASGIFLKHNSLDELLNAIRQVASGEIWLDSDTVRVILAGKRTQTESMERTLPLTLRQGEVMRGILDGLGNKEIGSKLKVSESSVKAVIQELFQKAGVRTRSQLVRIAIEKHSSDWLKPGVKE